MLLSNVTDSSPWRCILRKGIAESERPSFVRLSYRTFLLSPNNWREIWDRRRRVSLPEFFQIRWPVWNHMPNLNNFSWWIVIVQPIFEAVVMKHEYGLNFQIRQFSYISNIFHKRDKSILYHIQNYKTNACIYFCCYVDILHNYLRKLYIHIKPLPLFMFGIWYWTRGD